MGKVAVEFNADAGRARHALELAAARVHLARAHLRVAELELGGAVRRAGRAYTPEQIEKIVGDRIQVYDALDDV